MNILKKRIFHYKNISSFGYNKRLVTTCTNNNTNTFVGNNTFLKVFNTCPSINKKFTIVGVPYDGACTNRPGTRFGPKAIRDASHMLCDATHALFHLSPIKYLTDYGDLVLPHTDINAMRKKLESDAVDILKSYEHVVWLGGDHSITLSLLRAQKKKYGMFIVV